MRWTRFYVLHSCCDQPIALGADGTIEVWSGCSARLVKSYRSLEEFAADHPEVWHGDQYAVVPASTILEEIERIQRAL